MSRAIVVERRAPYQGVPQYGITGEAEITPSRKTAELWAALENAARRVKRNPENRGQSPDIEPLVG